MSKDNPMDEKQPQKGSDPDGDSTYVYRHAGIQERDGRIPLWLLMVCIGLIVWSIYYTIRYWSEG
jgi:hypothetical protein